ncbi:MAG: hypothetical protein EOM12_17320 [Verrucomicrobiae bacterium]|nr:hypothetical protein [Verrucomicrobiae bacterium]
MREKPLKKCSCCGRRPTVIRNQDKYTVLCTECPENRVDDQPGRAEASDAWNGAQRDIYKWLKKYSQTQHID